MPTTINDKLISCATDIDQGTIRQAETTARLPTIEGHVALMPHAHVVIGATVGSVIPTSGAVIPSAVGVSRIESAIPPEWEGAMTALPATPSHGWPKTSPPPTWRTGALPRCSSAVVIGVVERRSLRFAPRVPDPPQPPVVGIGLIAIVAHRGVAAAPAARRYGAFRRADSQRIYGDHEPVRSSEPSAPDG
jgi:hypothetical protein